MISSAIRSSARAYAPLIRRNIPVRLFSSDVTCDSPYGGSAPAPPTKRPKVTTLSLAAISRSGRRRITVCTAHDHPSALHVDRAGIDVLLVGDSLAMVALGHPTTLPITVDEMVHHCRAVGRADASCLVVADAPFGSYEACEKGAMGTAYRLVKEGGADAVEIGGGKRRPVPRCRTVAAVVGGGVPVMGHVGLTPQAIGVLGGFRAQGRTAVKARRILDEALALQDAGAFSIVLECVPAVVGRAITEALEIPTIGIGAGPHTSGQVLVYHDMLGMTAHPHHEQFVPRFCKKYAMAGRAIAEGLAEFRKEVEGGVFPGEDYSPYKMSEKETDAFERLLACDRDERGRAKGATANRLKDTDEYEQLRMYETDTDNVGGGGDKEIP
eukprot:CAMPEP_0194301008 /NCGR_PEP_ID=MMETSP0169-20130528/61570_1 /TAXON_ID=218684 /ORGANISM="Corethron pennatum, Strain L29A3" /LENGTH=382 /DNA_ID=CAMNT_0039051231 /DNA_START=158 /DNA_END=1305 /DNA_ORIENTATION=+